MRGQSAMFVIGGRPVSPTGHVATDRPPGDVPSNIALTKLQQHGRFALIGRAAGRSFEGRRGDRRDQWEAPTATSGGVVVSVSGVT